MWIMIKIWSTQEVAGQQGLNCETLSRKPKPKKPQHACQQA